MALEDLTGSGKYIDDLVSSNPAAGDNVSEGDDHIRGLKNVLKLSFPAITGAVTPTHTELNYVDGVTSAIQTQLNAITANDWVVTARIADDAITSALIADDAVVTASIADGAVDTARLGADAVTGAKIADDAINSEHYTDGSIDTAHIADLQVTTAKIAADAITGAKIADDAIDSEHYAAGSIDTAHIADDAVTGGKIADDALDSNHYADGSIDLAHLASSLGDLSTKDVTYIGNNNTNHRFNGTTDQRFTVNGSEEMRLEADGDLHVDGDVIAFSTTISDATLKYDINPVEFALDKINQLKGVSYKYKHNDRESAGLLAQDVEKVMPSAVKSRKVPLVTGDDKEYKTLHYDSMTAILVEAIKELTAKVKKLENR